VGPANIKLVWKTHLILVALVKRINNRVLVKQLPNIEVPNPKYLGCPEDWLRTFLSTSNPLHFFPPKYLGVGPLNGPTILGVGTPNKKIKINRSPGGIWESKKQIKIL
jgi:hypothetical protein